MNKKTFRDLTIVFKGAGDLGSGVALRLFRAGFKRILMLEIAAPLAIRRFVAFSEALHDDTMTVEGIEAVRVCGKNEILEAWRSGKIAVRVDPKWESIREFKPDVVVDAILAKRNLGTNIWEAPLVVGLGPGFTAGMDCHVVVETNRGHNLGRLIYRGRAEANTGIPGNVGGYTRERIVRSPSDGLFIAEKKIGDPVRKGEVIGRVGGKEVVAAIDGVLRGLIRHNFPVTSGLKIGDIDPRGDGDYCYTVSDKARALGGSVLEAILSHYDLCDDLDGRKCAPC
ncbi:MAG: selenium-dependent molybdenum cofactor biosynthesis protein YqeB [Deltaproteobacteria bacterium]|jgi:xanthine dehydrogenase accessory factor|nr:selenium-dependent molybdenum cofactor biosynthesis protein YqeB [Deltaproteobacteria bacterium]